ncbi:hypothetical protein K8T06_14585, partial [bacterium]|nr:hypothetical protein [bacterium]
DSNTTQISGYWGVVSGYSSQCRKPDIEIDSNGNPHIFWSQRHDDSEEQHHFYLDIYYRNSINGGNTWLYEDTTNQRHGYNVTRVAPGEWVKFLPQRPRFKIDINDDIQLIYTVIYKNLGSTSQDPDLKTIYYLKIENLWNLDPPYELFSTYIDKTEADIAIRYISGNPYPYIAYIRRIGTLFDQGRAIVRLCHQDTGNNWHDKLVFQDTPNSIVLTHFPCISIYGSEICITTRHHVGLQIGPLNHQISVKKDVTGSGSSWTTVNVDDTTGIGYVSYIRHDSGNLYTIYRDTVPFGGLSKPDLYFDLN